MSNDIKTFFSRLNPRNLKFGIKVQLLTISLVIISLLITSIAGLAFIKKAFISATNQRIEDLGLVKKTQIEDYFSQLNQRMRVLANDDIIAEALGDFKEAYQNYSVEVDLYEVMKTGNQVLEVYYKSDIAEYIEGKSTLKSQIMDFYPNNDITKALQYFYLALNPKEINEKDKFFQSKDSSYYAGVHSQYHIKLRDIVKQNDFSDLFLIDDKTGDIYYSVKKNIDFGTNLYKGPYSNSKLAAAFKSVSATNNVDFVHIEDFSSYLPAGYQPVMFVATPIYSYGEKTGVLVVQLSHEKLNDILYGESLSFEQDNNVEYNLVGKDYLLRNNPKDLITDKKEYMIDLRKRLGDENISALNVIDNLNCAIMYEGYGKDLNTVWASDDRLHIMKDYKGRTVFAHLIPLSISGLKWDLITKIDQKESMKTFVRARFLMYSIFIFLVVLIIFVTKRFSNSIKSRLIQLKDSLTILFKGEQTKELITKSKDEVGDTIEAYNNLRGRLIDASAFAIEMSKGNYEGEFVSFGEHDAFGQSLNNLKQSLIDSEKERAKRAEEDRIRNWTNDGLAKFNDLLRQHNENIEVLSYNVIKNLIEYLEANQGGIFMVEEEGKEKYIELVASYAYDRQKFLIKRIELGEGLLGNTVLEKRTLYLKDIPEDYMEITSGLGKATPRNLIIVPLIIEDEVLGLIELASFNEIKPYEIEFIERIADNTAATMVTVRLNTKTTELLKESTNRANAIQQQEEEMRQNMEEMQATQEELARLRQEDEKRSKAMQDTIENTNLFLRSMVNNMYGSVMLKDKDGIIILANDEFAKTYGLEVSKVIGKADIDIMSQNEVAEEHKLDQEVMTEGEKTWDEEKTIGKKTVTLRCIKKPFFIDTIKQSGILTIKYILAN